jgi:hypothetical protein
MGLPAPSRQATATLTFAPDPFIQEVLFLFNFTKDGSDVLKIASVVEHVDSSKVKVLMAEMASGPPPSK